MKLIIKSNKCFNWKNIILKYDTMVIIDTEYNNYFGKIRVSIQNLSYIRQLCGYRSQLVNKFLE